MAENNRFRHYLENHAQTWRLSGRDYKLGQVPRLDSGCLCKIHQSRYLFEFAKSFKPKSEVGSIRTILPGETRAVEEVIFRQEKIEIQAFFKDMTPKSEEPHAFVCCIVSYQDLSGKKFYTADARLIRIREGSSFVYHTIQDFGSKESLYQIYK